MLKDNDQNRRGYAFTYSLKGKIVGKEYKFVGLVSPVCGAGLISNLKSLFIQQGEAPNHPCISIEIAFC